MSTKLPRLNPDQNNFIIECLAAGMPIKAIVPEFQAMFPSFGYGADIDDDDISTKIYQRIQKIKEKRANEIQALRDTDPTADENAEAPYLSARWRARRFHSLLLNVGIKDAQEIQLEIKILKEIRAEAKLLGMDDDKDKVENPPLRDLVSELRLDPKKFENITHLGAPAVRRLSDDQDFNENGKGFLCPVPEDRRYTLGVGIHVSDPYDTNDPRFWDWIDKQYEKLTSRRSQTNKNTDVENEHEDSDDNAPTDEQTLDASDERPDGTVNTDDTATQNDTPDETKIPQAWKNPNDIIPTSGPRSEPDISDFHPHAPVNDPSVKG